MNQLISWLFLLLQRNSHLKLLIAETMVSGALLWAPSCDLSSHNSHGLHGHYLLSAA